MLGEGDAGLRYASWRAGDTYGFVRRRMALHRPPSSQPHRMETPQTSRLTGDPCCSFLHPKKRLPLAAPDPRGLPASEDRLDGLITNDKFCFTRRRRLKL